MNLRKTLLPLFLSLLASIAQAAGTFVQDNAAWDDSGDPVSTWPCAYSSDVTSGTLLYVSASFSINQTPTVADSRGNSWTAIGSDWDAGEEAGVIHWYAISNGAGANTVTVSYPSTSQSSKVYVHEASGITASSPLDGFNQNAANMSTGTDAASSGTFTPATSNTYIIASYLAVNNVTVTVGTNFTARHNGTGTTRVYGETRVLAVAALTAGTFTVGSAGTAGISAAAFKETGGGGTTPLRRRRSN